MNSIKMLLLLVSFFVLTGADTSCKPRSTIIPTTDGEDVTEPYVEVFRCSGYTPNTHLNYRCIPSAQMNFNITLHSVHHNDNFESKIFYNHTACKMGCVCGSSCGNERHVVPCDDGKEWSAGECKCKTNIDNCGTSTNVGGKDKENSVSMATFFVSLVIEFFVFSILTLAIVDVCKCRKHSTGVIYRTAKYVRSMSSSMDKNGWVKNDRTGTGSVSFLHDINTYQNSQVAV